MNDLDMADLLGERPQTPDPAFRFDVFARLSAKARQRAAIARSVRLVAISLAIGLAAPLARAAGLTLAHLAPMALVAGVLGLAYVLAHFATGGPGAVLARSRTVLRARLRTL